MSTNIKKRLLVATLDLQRALKSDGTRKDDVLCCLNALRFEIDSFARVAVRAQGQLEQDFVY